MRKIMVHVVLTLLYAVLFADGVQPPGSGSSGNPYLVSTLDHLLWVSTNSSSWGSEFELRAHIDASATSGWNSGEGFLPIGTSSLPFTGNFNGYFGSIDGLVINRSTSDNQGLFGYVDDGVIDYTRLTNIVVNGRNQVGGLIGYAVDSHIVACEVDGNIQGSYGVGGAFGGFLYHVIGKEK